MSGGVVAWLFGVTGPLLIVLQAAENGNLSFAETTSWVFSIYVVGGLLTILLSIYYRQPIAVAFSIPGAVLVSTTMLHHSFSDVIGAYVVTGLLVLVLGLTKVVDKIMNILPMPVMMGMVSGVLLPFGVNIFTAITDNPFINGTIFFAFLALSFFQLFVKWFPPILGVIVVAFALFFIFDLGDFSGIQFGIAQPGIFLPSFNMATMGELVIPLALTVIAIQNAQGIGVLKSMKYDPPVNAMTNWSGIGSLVNSVFGAHSACIAGPMTAILADDNTGPKEGRYAGAVIMGILWVLFGLFAPVSTSLTNAVPASFINLLGGLALIGVLQNCLQMTFSGSFKIGALFSFLITISGVTVLGVGAPFWGLVGGTLVSFLLEPKDYANFIKRQSNKKTEAA